MHDDDSLSEAMKDALSGAYEVDGVWYHDGMTATGRALYARKLVGFDGNLTEGGHAIRSFLLAKETSNAQP